MEYFVTEPDDCPFLRHEDIDGFPDGCEYDETACYDGREFPADCPLRNGSITVSM